MERPASHRYPFQGLPGRLLYAGHLEGGQAVLVGPLPPHVLVLEFDTDGRLRKVQEVDCGLLKDRAALAHAVQTCFDKLKATPGVIWVGRFSSDNPESPLAPIQERSGCSIQISDLPPELDYAEDEDPEEEQATEDFLKERKDWLDSGSYVLTWGDTFFVNNEGRVYST